MIQYFEHEGNNYAVIRSDEPRNHLCFQDLKIDSQIILSSIGHDKKIEDDVLEEILDGLDSPYPDSSVYFIPNAHIETATARVEQVVQGWLDHLGLIDYDVEVGDIYIAYRKSPSGLWIFFYDGTTAYAAQAIREHLFEGILEIPDNPIPTDTSVCHLSVTEEECSGDDFLNSRGFDEQRMIDEGEVPDPILELMKAEGII